MSAEEGIYESMFGDWHQIMEFFSGEDGKNNTQENRDHVLATDLLKFLYCSVDEKYIGDRYHEYYGEVLTGIESDEWYSLALVSNRNSLPPDSFVSLTRSRFPAAKLLDWRGCLEYMLQKHLDGCVKAPLITCVYPGISFYDRHLGIRIDEYM